MRCPSRGRQAQPARGRPGRAQPPSGTTGPDRSAALVPPTDRDLLFRTAVVHALAGRVQAALDALEKGIASGLDRDAVRDEEDFESLRNEPRFKALVGAPRGRE